MAAGVALDFTPALDELARLVAQRDAFVDLDALVDVRLLSHIHAPPTAFVID